MNVMGIIFTNDGNVGELTNKRTMASLPFGGRYRQVDFGLSNLAFAGVRHVGIIARYSYQSLMNHIGQSGFEEAWSWGRADWNSSPPTPPPSTTPTGASWRACPPTWTFWSTAMTTMW